MEVKHPVKLRVKVAFGFVSVGYIYFSPPMPATRKDDLIRMGFLEVVNDEEVQATETVAKKRGRPRHGA